MQDKRKIYKLMQQELKRSQEVYAQIISEYYEMQDKIYLVSKDFSYNRILKS